MVSPAIVYARHRPEETTLYNVVRENLDTLYDAVDEGAIAIALPKFVRKELEGDLDCGHRCFSIPTTLTAVTRTHRRRLDGALG